MLTFKRVFREKLGHDRLRQLYERECHVCQNTLHLFGTLLTESISLERLAAETDTDVASLIDLRDADYCDPQLVVRICRYLKLDPPRACPRLT